LDEGNEKEKPKNENQTDLEEQASEEQSEPIENSEDSTSDDTGNKQPVPEVAEPQVVDEEIKETKEKEEPKEESKEKPKEEPKEESKEEPKEEPKDMPEDETKETPTETPPKEKKQPGKPKKSKKTEDGQEAAQKPTKDAPEQENPDFKYIVRIANTNVDGNRTISEGLIAIKGIGNRLAIAIMNILDFPKTKKVGDLTDDEVEKLIKIVENINTEVPGWMKNRQKDFDSGEDLHIISADIQRLYRDDINRLKKIRCYRGIRHEQGQKVRGQRTRANGRSGATVGVQRKRVQQQAAKKKG
jgi:small subunit ribosomal protein S13